MKTDLSENSAAKAEGEPAQPTREITLRNGFGEFPAFAFDVANARQAVAIVPALGTPARNYFRLGREFAARGIAAVVVELRGVGSSPVRASRRVDFGYRELLRGETQALMTQLATDYPDANRQMLAHSLGAHLALLYAGYRFKPAPQGVTIIAAGTPYRRAYGASVRAGLWLLRGLIAISTFVTGVWHGHKLGFGGRQPARLMREWSHLARTGALAARDGEEVLRFTAVPASVAVHAVRMRDDSFAPQAATAHLLHSVSRDVEPTTIGKLAGGRRADHFSWLKHPGSVVQEILALWSHPDAVTPQDLPADPQRRNGTDASDRA